MDVVQAPAERFAHLPDFAYETRTCTVELGLAMRYVDEGHGRSILLLHGEPTYGFLYRKMIPPLVSAGFRVIVPDLIGFGRSDQLTDLRAYSYARHVEWLVRFIEHLNLQDAVLFGQDWGSLLGLRLAAENEARFARIVIANGMLPLGDRPPSAAFSVWRAFARYSPVFPIGRIVASGCVTKLSPELRAAYDAPFPSDLHKAGARAFPRLVPTRPDDPAVPANRAAWEVLRRWEKPFLTLFGKNDPILGRSDARLKREIPGAHGQPNERFWGGHFVQEDRGDYLAERLIAWLGS
jgi:haloalkane dehalogenase